MSIAIVGTEHVGTVTGICLAELGNAFCHSGVHPSVVERLTSVQGMVYELEFEDVFHRKLKKGCFHFPGDLYKSVLFVDVVIERTGSQDGMESQGGSIEQGRE